MSSEEKYLAKRRSTYQKFLAKGFSGVLERTAGDDSEIEIEISGVGTGASTLKDEFGAAVGDHSYVIAMKEDSDVIEEMDRLVTDTRDEVVIRANPIRIGETIVMYDVITRNG